MSTLVSHLRFSTASVDEFRITMWTTRCAPCVARLSSGLVIFSPGLWGGCWRWATRSPQHLWMSFG